MKVDKERKNVKRTDRHRQNGQTDKERELTHANLGPIGIPFNTSIVRQTETQRHRQTNIYKTDTQIQKERKKLLTWVPTVYRSMLPSSILLPNHRPHANLNIKS